MNQEKKMEGKWRGGTDKYSKNIRLQNKYIKAIIY